MFRLSNTLSIVSISLKSNGFNKITLEKEKALENTDLVNIYALK